MARYWHALVLGTTLLNAVANAQTAWRTESPTGPVHFDPPIDIAGDQTLQMSSPAISADSGPADSHTSGLPHVYPNQSAAPYGSSYCGRGNGPEFTAPDYQESRQRTAPDCASKSECFVESPSSKEEFFFSNVGVRFGAFTFRDEIGSEVYGSIPTVGIELKRHLGNSPLALSTSLDFTGGKGDPIVIGGPVICESELSAFAWRLTAFLEPRPGKWGSADGDFYFNPYIGAGVGYHVLREQLSVSLAYQALQVDETVDGLGFHAVLGADFVIKRRLSLGFSLISSVVKKDVGWREAELGGDVVYFHADWRY